MNQDLQAARQLSGSLDYLDLNLSSANALVAAAENASQLKFSGQLNTLNQQMALEDVASTLAETAEVTASNQLIGRLDYLDLAETQQHVHQQAEQQHDAQKLNNSSSFADTYNKLQSNTLFSQSKKVTSKTAAASQKEINKKLAEEFLEQNGPNPNLTPSGPATAA